MTEEMIELYKGLNINDKRSELSLLIFKFDEIINQLLSKNNIDFDDFGSIKSYESIKQTLNTEDDMLLFLFEDLWNIKNKVLLMMLNNEIIG